MSSYSVRQRVEEAKPEHYEPVYLPGGRTKDVLVPRMSRVPAATLAQAVVVIEAARDCVFDGRTALGRERYRIFRDALRVWDALP